MKPLSVRGIANELSAMRCSVACRLPGAEQYAVFDLNADRKGWKRRGRTLGTFLRRWFCVAIGIAAGFGVFGCASELTVRDVDWQENFFDNEQLAVTVSSEMSRKTENFLNIYDLKSVYSQQPKVLLRELRQRFELRRERFYLELLSDISFSLAQEQSSPDDAAEYYLSAAYYSYLYLFQDNLEPTAVDFYDPEPFRQIRLYNASTAAIFNYLNDRNLIGANSFELDGASGNTFQFVKGKSIWRKKETTLPPFVAPELCANYKVENALTTSYGFGIGVPMIGKYPPREEGNAKVLRMLNDQTVAATLFLRLKTPERPDAKITASLEWFDPQSCSQIDINGHTVPLEYDLTTPFACFMRQPPLLSNLYYTFNPDAGLPVGGLYSFSEYEPGKIPVVLVHGLFSSPRTWAQMVNSLMANKEIRDKYQFWFFSYSTGNPILYSASLLRKSLQACRAELDPEHKDASWDRMVVIGHSMGGLLTKTLLQDTTLEESLRGLEFPSDLSKKELTDEQKKLIQQVLVFQYLPEVKRVIFLAVPHRGSAMATWKLAKWADSFVSFPATLLDNLYLFSRNIVTESDGKTTEPEEKIMIRGGIDGLDPDSKPLRYLQSLPFHAGVPFHSIIGNTMRSGTPGGSDGIVPYESSHLDDAQSELIVHSAHSVQLRAVTIEEVRRILLLHLRTPEDSPSIGKMIE